ncbi:MAG: TIGR02391 family protein [Anaerolineales bacterium]|nr:TIGR02391 family protein [Anaerolineales bacterium]
MTAIPSFSVQQLQAICNVLGDTSDGLTGSDIGMLLTQCGIIDPCPGITKRNRLYEALRQRQQQDRCANNVIAFIQAAMHPVRFSQDPVKFQSIKDRLNLVLSFAGYQLGEDGNLREISIARTLSEAEQRAGRLRSELLRRNVHPDVLHFCNTELLQDNYFHAVLEATKSVADKIRQITRLTGDGANLIDNAFGLKNGPLLAINTLDTESEISEHTGLANMIKGLFGIFRNPTAHAPRTTWVIKEQDALDLLTMVSYIHRQLDRAVPTTKRRTQ